MTKRQIYFYEIIGIIAIPLFILGLFKGIPGFTNQYPWTIFFANETLSWSTYIRIGFWSALFFAFIQYFIFGRKIKNFIVAKVVGILIFTSLMSFIYIVYSMVGIFFLSIDLRTLIIITAIAQHISSRLLISKSTANLSYNRLTIIILILMAVIFIIESHL